MQPTVSETATMPSVDQLKGLGPKSRAMLAQIGITSAAQVRAADAFALYAQLQQVVPNLSLNMLYALIGAQEDLPWQQIKHERKTEILLRLDDLGLAPKRK
ncbi:TfoX/Sxy family DNA transformation protein [Chitinibacter tainanensis]|uniref:TfoX/Sxy family DNA transformation protein n=1 Tax=Chitinibacter tainanensis TaxID=230667 RepID=UPI0003F50E6F|nr:TfoX/Sxy family DNA transformation protein [Chitinibacter tainanensis]